MRAHPFAIAGGIDHRDQRAVVAQHLGKPLAVLRMAAVGQQHHHGLRRTFRTQHLHRAVMPGGISVLQMARHGVAATANQQYRDDPTKHLDSPAHHRNPRKRWRLDRGRAAGSMEIAGSVRCG